MRNEPANPFLSARPIAIMDSSDNLEIIHPGHPRGGFRFCLFDFDGTLSLIREGWQGVMIPMMVEMLLETRSGETAAELDAVVREYVTRLTGKQTIYQMIQLRHEVEKRNGNPLDPLAYKQKYLDLLWTRIEHRVAGLIDGSIAAREMLVPGSVELLTALRDREIVLFLASGTDYQYVHNEAKALKLDDFFGGGVYGAVDNYRSFSKKMVIERILEENGLSGPELLTFGDGYVEIENTKEVNGVAVGVATDEVGRQRADEWKRARLIQAGADVIIPHFGNHASLISYLFAED